jgi:hypothetical protein
MPTAICPVHFALRNSEESCKFHWAAIFRADFIRVSRELKNYAAASRVEFGSRKYGR